MKDIKDFISELKESSPQVVEIGNHLVCSTEKIDDLESNLISHATYIGDNKIIIFESINSECLSVERYDLKLGLSEQRARYSHSLKTGTTTTSSILLDDPEYIAFGNNVGQVSILNVDTLQIYDTFQIDNLQSAKKNGSPVSLYKHYGCVYGVSGFYPNAIFFVGPSNKKEFCPKKFKLEKNYYFGDVVLDQHDQLILPQGIAAKLGKNSLKDISKLKAEFVPLGSKMKFLHNNSPFNYLISLDKFNQGESAFIFKGKDGHINQQLYSAISASGKILQDIEVLSEKDLQVILTSNKSSYIYDLPTKSFLGKIQPPKNMQRRFMYDGVWIVNSPHYSENNFSIARMYGMKRKGDLAKILDALAENKSVTTLMVSRHVFDKDALLSLCHLKKTRPGLKIQLPKGFQDAFDFMNDLKIHEELCVEALEKQKTNIEEKENIIKELKLAVSETEKNFDLKLIESQKRNETLELKSKEQSSLNQNQINSLEDQLSMQIKKNEALDLQLKEQSLLNQNQIKSLEDELSMQTKKTVALVEKEKNYQSTIKQSKDEIVAYKTHFFQISKKYEDLIQNTSVTMQSLSDKLHEAKDINKELHIQLRH